MAVERKARLLFPVSSSGDSDPVVRSVLAAPILMSRNITLATSHVSGVRDQATARNNVSQTMFEAQARRSAYENAPGGAHALSIKVMRAMIELARVYSFGVSELCGGSHSVSSTHYRGLALDVNTINGQRVSATHADLSAFINDCKQLGATRVIGPPAPGHTTHVHAEWMTQ